MSFVLLREYVRFLLERDEDHVEDDEEGLEEFSSASGGNIVGSVNNTEEDF